MAATSYEGPATLHSDGVELPVQVRLSTTLSTTYSWQGRATTPELAALTMRGQGGTLTLSTPDQPAGEVHVAVAELDPDHGGVVLRLHGAGRAPYETSPPHPGPGGSTVYEMKPQLGDTEPNPPGLCSYELADGSTCGAAAAWHGITLDPEPTGLESCDHGDHLTVMSDIAKWIHPWTQACADGEGFEPATNRCIPSR